MEKIISRIIIAIVILAMAYFAIFAVLAMESPSVIIFIGLPLAWIVLQLVFKLWDKITK